MTLDTLVHSWQGKFRNCGEAKRVIRFAYKDDRGDLIRAYLDDVTLDHSEYKEAREELIRASATSDYFEKVALVKLVDVLTKYADTMEAMVIKCVCETIQKEQKK